MRIAGIQKLSMVDYPGKLACTLFVQGCNFRCPFCHNNSVVNMDDSDLLVNNDIYKFLRDRRGLLDAIVLSGGEPLALIDAIDFLRFLKEEFGKDYLIKLDTNGSYPDRLERILKEKLVDYVAMDVKTSMDKYSDITGRKTIVTPNILQSIYTIKDNSESCGYEYEFRTTMIKEFHDKETMKILGVAINGCDNYYLQKFVDSGDLIDKEHEYHAFSDEEMKEFAEMMRPYSKHVGLRGVE